MKKAYCLDCRLAHLSPATSWDIPTSQCLAPPTCHVKEDVGWYMEGLKRSKNKEMLIFCAMKNKNNDCSDFEMRKWKKFWGFIKCLFGGKK